MNAPAAAPLAAAQPKLVVLIGNPNSGKTTLFNALTTSRAHVANYPGVTVEHREAVIDLGDARRARVVDLPGTYSLVPRAEDEEVALRGLLGRIPGMPRPALCIAVADATNLERNLYLVELLRELGLPMLVALTMMDTVEADGTRIDHALLSRRIGVPVVPVAAGRGLGLDALREAMRADRAIDAEAPLPPPLGSRPEIAALGGPLAAGLSLPGDPMSLGLWALALRAGNQAGLLDPLLSEARSPESRQTAPGAAASIDDKLVHDTNVDDQRGHDKDVHGIDVIDAEPDAGLDARLAGKLIAEAVAARYARVNAWMDGAVTRLTPAGQSRSEKLTARIDALALHRVLGPIFLVLIFGALFQALFSWSKPVMDALSDGMHALGGWLSGLLPASFPLLRSLIVDGVIAGAGNVIVFVPQIVVLFLFLGLLEDSGYLARAAFLLDRLLSRVGLHGRAFVPMLSGFACAVPAILAARTIENRKDRLVTILVTPLVSCSARLPVYGLMIATVFATRPPILGFIQVGAVVMIAMYALSIFAALGMAAVFKRTLLQSPPAPFVLELPPYRRPRLAPLLRHVWSKVQSFLVSAGTVILAITIVLWGLFNFPRSSATEAEYQQAKAELQQRESATSRLHDQSATRGLQIAAAPARAGSEEPLAAEREELEARYAKLRLEHSIAGRAGHFIEPALRPFGWDWKVGVGIIASFAAREVLVSTLGLVYGLGQGAEDKPESLQDAMRNDRDARGKPVHTPLSGLSLMVFFVLAMQCMSTLATVRRETGSWRWPAFQFGYMLALALCASFAVYQGGRLLGFS